MRNVNLEYDFSLEMEPFFSAKCKLRAPTRIPSPAWAQRRCNKKLPAPEWHIVRRRPLAAALGAQACTDFRLFPFKTPHDPYVGGTEVLPGAVGQTEQS